MLHTWQKSYNLRRNEENLAAKLLKIRGEILTAKLKDLGANLIIDHPVLTPLDLVMSLDVPGMRFGLNLTKITNLTVEKM